MANRVDTRRDAIMTYWDTSKPAGAAMQTILDAKIDPRTVVEPELALEVAKIRRANMYRGQAHPEEHAPKNMLAWASMGPLFDDEAPAGHPYPFLFASRALAGGGFLPFFRAYAKAFEGEGLSVQNNTLFVGAQDRLTAHIARAETMWRHTPGNAERVFTTVTYALAPLATPHADVVAVVAVEVIDKDGRWKDDADFAAFVDMRQRLHVPLLGRVIEMESHAKVADERRVSA